MNYYPFHIGDFRSGTAHLTNEQELAYRRAIDWYYDTEQPIPLETQWVARRLRVETEDLQVVLEDFFERTDEGWRNARCDKEITHYKAIAERNKTNGSKGGRPRKNPVGSQSVPSGIPLESQPRTKNQEPNTPKAPTGVDARFDKFWAAYPKKIGKDVARKRFEQRKPDDALLDQMLAAINIQKRTDQWVRDGGQYIPNPATWLSQGRWQDGHTTTPTTNGVGVHFV